MCCVGHANNRSLPASPTGSRSSVAPNPCVDAADACTADERCHRLRTAYVVQCLGRAAPGGCLRARCRRALRHFFARGPPALTHALLFCPCGGPACAERRRQTFVPSCAFSGPGPAPPSCLGPLDACEHSRICRCRRRWSRGRRRDARAGVGATRRPLTAFRPRGAGPASWPSRPPARPQPAALTAASETRPPAACAPMPASWVCTARRGSPGDTSAWMGRLPSFRGLARHSHHAQLRGQRKRARGALVRLQSQRKSA